MRKQLYYHLANTAAITALVGSRIYPQRVPTSAALPYLDFEFTERAANYDQGGYDDYNSAIVVINSNAATLLDATALGAEVFTALNIQNVLIGEVGSQEELCSTTLQTEFDSDELNDGSEDGVRILTQTYTISYMEA